MIKSVNPKGNQPWIFIGRTDVKAKVPTLWPPGVKSWLVGKDPDAGKDWSQKEKWVTEDKMYSVDIHFNKLWGIVEDTGDWQAAVHGNSRVRHDLVTEQQQ